MKTIQLATAISALMLGLAACGGGSSSDDDTGDTGVSKEQLGMMLFMDESLSSEGNQACGSCHSPDHGFADPDVSSTAPVSEGSVAGAFGNRNAPTAAYAAFIPPFRPATSFGASPETDADPQLRSRFEGGQFLDGRRPSLKEQAKDPFLNPVEMNNADPADVVTKVRNGMHAGHFKEVFGDDIFDQNTDVVYDKIAEAIAEFEKSSMVNPFSSKFDAWLAGSYTMTQSERNGMLVFQNKAKCNNCHSLEGNPEFGNKVLFTNFKYYNIGTPPNPDNPAGSDFRDGGLGESLASNAGQYDVAISSSDETTERGKFRTPTLRNVELTAPYMHNGRYQTLREVITHYDITVSSAEAGFTPAKDYPEVDTNIAAELNFGDPNLNPALGLTQQEMDDLEAFLLTLTDGYM